MKSNGVNSMTAAELTNHLEQRLAFGETLPEATILTLYADPEADMTNVIARWMFERGVAVYGAAFNYDIYADWLEREKREDTGQARADFLVRTETYWGIQFGKKSFGEAVVVQPPLNRATHRWLNNEWISTVNAN